MRSGGRPGVPCLLLRWNQPLIFQRRYMCLSAAAVPSLLRCAAAGSSSAQRIQAASSCLVSRVHRLRNTDADWSFPKPRSFKLSNDWFSPERCIQRLLIILVNIRQLHQNSSNLEDVFPDDETKTLFWWILEFWPVFLRRFIAGRKSNTDSISFGSRYLMV